MVNLTLVDSTRLQLTLFLLSLKSFSYHSIPLHHCLWLSSLCHSVSLSLFSSCLYLSLRLSPSSLQHYPCLSLSDWLSFYLSLFLSQFFLSCSLDSFPCQSVSLFLSSQPPPHSLSLSLSLSLSFPLSHFITFYLFLFFSLFLFSWPT